MPTDAAQCQETFTIGRKGYRQRVMETTARDPFICSRCGGELILWRIWHPSYGVIYDEEERLKSGEYERPERRDPDVGDLPYSHYNYRCRDCGYEAKVEDMVVDSFPPSTRSKHHMPELQCFCGCDLCYVKDL